MKNRIIPISISFLLLSAAMLSCSVGNKEIPTPSSSQAVDTSGGTSTFSLALSGDTTYALNVKVLVDTVVNDTLLVSGIDLTTQDKISFATHKDSVGVYVATLPTGFFLFNKKTTAGYTNIVMSQGSISITQRDTATKIYRGYINVNNNNIYSQPHYTISGNFVVKN